MDKLICDRCGVELSDKNMVLTRFLSPDRKTISEYGQICRRCYGSWNREYEKLKAENSALREQLEGLQKRFDQINNFEQSQCAKLLAEIAKRDKTLARVTAERDAAQAALKAMRFAYINGDTDCPHQFEMDAMRQANEILGEWPQKEDGRNGD